MNILRALPARYFSLASGLLLSDSTPISAQASQKTLREFRLVEGSSTVPKSSLIEGTNGVLYGLSLGGGESQKGTVFELDKKRDRIRVIHSFTGTNGDGSYPAGSALLLAANGLLHGSTRMGGCSNFGTVFRLDHHGKNYLVLRSFGVVAGDGKFPQGLMQASNGLLYGTTYGGGDSNQGIIYRINASGCGYAIVRSFAGGSTDGGQPFAPLVQANNGMLIGTTCGGGANGLGTIFALNIDGRSYQIFWNFIGPPNDGAQPRARLTPGADGWLYGTTYKGGSSNSGAAFRVKDDGSSY